MSKWKDKSEFKKEVLKYADKLDISTNSISLVAAARPQRHLPKGTRAQPTGNFELK